MHEIAERFPQKKGSGARELGVPYAKDLRLALNVAACDARQLVIVRADDQSELQRLNAKLSDVAWSQGVAGLFVYARYRNEHKADAKVLAKIDGASKRSGFFVVSPDTYGAKGRSVAFVPSSASPRELRSGLLAAAKQHKASSKDSRAHIRAARAAGIRWESATPVTDKKGQRSTRRRR